MNDLNLAGVEARFDHVAFAAPRIKDLLPLYQDLLGGEFYRGGDNTRVGFRAVQLSYANRIRVELLEPLPGSTFFDSFFDRTGGGGPHHVTFLVNDMATALRAIDGSPYSPAGVFLELPEWQEVFLHPKQTGGTLVQLVATDGTPPARTSLDQVLAGNGEFGNGVPSR